MPLDTWPPEEKDKKPKKKLSFENQDELQTSLKALELKNFKGSEIITPTQEQTKKEELELQAENELSLQTVSDDAKSIEELTQQAVEAAKLSQNEEHFPVEETIDVPATLEDKYHTPVAEEISQVIKNLPDGTDVYEDIRTDEEKQRSSTRVGGLKKLVLATTMFFAGLSGAKAEGGKNEDPKKPTQEQTVDTKKARPVKDVPPGYNPIGKEGDKTLYAKKWGGKLEKAKQGSAKANPEQYMQEMIAKVKSGISPQELLDQGYITPAAAEELTQYVDVVYTQPEALTKQEIKKSDGPKYAKEGERYFGPNNHAVADVYFESRASKDASDGGSLNTSNSMVKIQLLDDATGSKTLGQPIGNPVELSGEEAREYVNAMTTHIKSPEALNMLRKKAGLATETTYTLTGDDIASGTTLK